MSDPVRVPPRLRAGRVVLRQRDEQFRRLDRVRGRWPERVHQHGDRVTKGGLDLARPFGLDPQTGRFQHPFGVFGRGGGPAARRRGHPVHARDGGRRRETRDRIDRRGRQHSCLRQRFHQQPQDQAGRSVRRGDDPRGVPAPVGHGPVRRHHRGVAPEVARCLRPDLPRPRSTAHQQRLLRR